jgi:hypothetical protein
MDLNSFRADGWEDVFLLLLTTLSAVVLWYTHGFYVTQIAFLAGIGPGIIWYFIVEFTEDHPVPGFPITMIFILLMLVAASEKSLVVGVVTTFATTTTLKVHEVYWNN